MKRKSLFFIFGFLLVIALLFICFGQGGNMPLALKLKTPLLLSGVGAPNQTYVLPAGTSLYYDQAFPEGFVRYKIYVNVEGVKLDSTESTEKFWIDPLTAFPPDANQLRQLLATYPLSKTDLSAILGSGVLSKVEIKELLEEYSCN